MGQPDLAKTVRNMATAVGAGKVFPIVLIELADQILGVLVAESECSGRLFDRVLYFRSVFGVPHAGLVDMVVEHESVEAVKMIVDKFGDIEGFRKAADSLLVGPDGYSDGMGVFLDKYRLWEPDPAKRGG